MKLGKKDPQPTTTHEKMRENVAHQLTVSQHNLAIATHAVSTLNLILDKATSYLTENQVLRGSLLMRVEDAKTAVQRAETAHHLASGTPAQAEREVALQEAKAVVSALTKELMLLAEDDTRARTAAEPHRAQLEQATATLLACQQEVHDITALYNEVDTRHMTEVKENALAALTSVRQERETLREQLKVLDDACAEEQQHVVAQLCEWPVFARQVLTEHGEIAPDRTLEAIELKLAYIRMCEEHFTEIDAGAPRYQQAGTLHSLLSMDVPLDYFGRYGESPATIAAKNETLPHGKKRGVPSDIARYAMQANELKAEYERRLANHRENVVVATVTAEQAKLPPVEEIELPYSQDLDVAHIEVSLAPFVR